MDGVSNSRQQICYWVCHHGLINHLPTGDRRLPTGLFSTGNETIQTEVTKANSANLEFPIDASRAPTQITPSLNPTAELRLAFCLFNLRFTCHLKTNSKVTGPMSHS